VKGKHIHLNFGRMPVNIHSGLSVESCQRTHDSELIFDQQKYRSTSQAPMDGSRFCGLQAYIIFVALFMKKNTKLGMRLNIYLWPPTQTLEGALKLKLQ